MKLLRLATVKLRREMHRQTGPCPWRQQMIQEGHFNEQELGVCNNDPDECECQWVREGEGAR